MQRKWSPLIQSNSEANRAKLPSKLSDASRTAVYCLSSSVLCLPSLLYLQTVPNTARSRSGESNYGSPLYRAPVVFQGPLAAVEVVRGPLAAVEVV